MGRGERGFSTRRGPDGVVLAGAAHVVSARRKYGLTSAQPQPAQPSASHMS